MTASIHERWAYLLVMSFGMLAIGCDPDPSVDFGEKVFNDPNLSANNNQSCASCHSRDTGGTGAESELNAHGAVYEGSIAGRFGNRKPPASAYASFAPLFMHDSVKGFVGGNFWDGRATGWKLGNPAADQAQGPFLNPVEQAVSSVPELVSRVCSSDYVDLFFEAWGDTACDDSVTAYDSIAWSIREFEGARRTSQFSSKYDGVGYGVAALSPLEAKGLKLFKGQAKCANCHTLDSDLPEGPLFTDFTFDNLGIPRNPENPFYGMDTVIIDGEPVNPLGADWVDPGLAGFLEKLATAPAWRELLYVTPSLLEMSQETLASLAQENLGKHRVPTLRNVDMRPSPSFVKAYGHNGYFKSLQGIVHFYNTRDILGSCDGAYTEAEALANNCWPVPEVSDNVNTADMGNLGLTAGDEKALVAFLGTLSDDWYQPPKR